MAWHTARAVLAAWISKAPSTTHSSKNPNPCPITDAIVFLAEPIFSPSIDRIDNLNSLLPTSTNYGLATLRLTIHDQKAQVLPAVSSILWLGSVVYPEFRSVKARKVRYSNRRLNHRYHAYCNNQISFTEFDASVQGWVNHVNFADSWGLCGHVLRPFRIRLGDFTVVPLTSKRVGLIQP